MHKKAMKPDSMMMLRRGIRGIRVSGLGLVLVLSALSGQAAAQDAMYKCVLPDGRIEYTNKTTLDTRGCAKLNIEPSVVVPAPRSATPAAPAAPAATPRPASSASAPTPANFPRVDSATQKARDTDRKRILEEELQAQQARLAELSKAYNNGEPERQGDEARNYQKYLDRVQRMKNDLARVQGDITSVKSELDKIR